MQGPFRVQGRLLRLLPPLPLLGHPFIGSTQLALRIL